ncbi:FAD:protein FMN transferase [Gangjinia marincola]|uniref:FAD:protein FMN transferase n=1 Tax=Gangjinia marincola TaxID=578463 RepID=A0ABN1MJ27_9FLAO
MKKLIFLFALTLLVACGKAPNKQVLSGRALGTTYNISYFDLENTLVERKVDSVIDAVNQSMSTYIDSSDISKINRGDSTIKVDRMFREVMDVSKDIHQRTQGIFDPTVGNLINFYGFGAEEKSVRVDSILVDSLMNYVGFEKVSISAEGYIKKENPEIYLEFNAIAKGYAIDRIGHSLRDLGADHFLIELGGELLAQGINIEKDKPWVVGVDDPITADRERGTQTALNLRNRGMATSGNYRKFKIDSITGQRYLHIINANTGYPEKTDVLSASVLAVTCAEADAYATAFMAMGVEESKKLLNSLAGIQAYLVYIDDADETQVFVTPGFEKEIVNP